MPFGDTVVRGRIDAVFADPDGGATVVDWKTGEPPRGPEAMRQAAVQLAVYRLGVGRVVRMPGIVGAYRLLLRAHRHHRRPR